MVTYTVRNISQSRVMGIEPGATAEVEAGTKLAKNLQQLAEGNTSMSEADKAYRARARFGDASPWPPKLALVAVDGEEPEARAKAPKGKGKGAADKEPDYSTALAEIEREADPKALEELAADKDIPTVVRQAIAKRIQTLAAASKR